MLCFKYDPRLIQNEYFTQTAGGLIRDPLRVDPVTDGDKVCGEAGNVALEDNLIASDDLRHPHIYSVALGGH